MYTTKYKGGSTSTSWFRYHASWKTNQKNKNYSEHSIWANYYGSKSLQRVKEKTVVIQLFLEYALLSFLCSFLKDKFCGVILIFLATLCFIIQGCNTIFIFRHLKKRVHSVCVCVTWNMRPDNKQIYLGTTFNNHSLIQLLITTLWNR